MPYCSNCGAENAVGASFCVQCGSAMGGAANPYVNPYAPPNLNGSYARVTHNFDPTPRKLPGFLGTIGKCLKLFSSYRGRASRREYWYWHLFMFLLTIFCLFVTITGISIGESGGGGDASAILALISMPCWIFYIAMIFPSLAVGARRFQDMDWPGWIYSIVCICTGVGLLVAPILASLKGTEGINAYGLQPGRNEDGSPVQG